MLVEEITFDSQQFAFVGEESALPRVIVYLQIEALLDNHVLDFVRIVLVSEPILGQSHTLLDLCVVARVVEVEVRIDYQMLVILGQASNHNPQFWIRLQ